MGLRAWLRWIKQRQQRRRQERRKVDVDVMSQKKKRSIAAHWRRYRYFLDQHNNDQQHSDNNEHNNDDSHSNRSQQQQQVVPLQEQQEQQPSSSSSSSTTITTPRQLTILTNQDLLAMNSGGGGVSGGSANGANGGGHNGGDDHNMMKSQHVIVCSSKLDHYMSKHMSDHDMMILLPRTHFSPIEFKLLKEYFMQMSNGHVLVDRAQSKYLFFSERYKQIALGQHMSNNNVNVEENLLKLVLNRIFNAVNLDGDGYISFAEFVQALSVAIHGTFEEKTQFSFRIYDANMDGKITKVEMLDYVTALSQLNILQMSSWLQTRRTRGDKEQIQLQRMASQTSLSEFKENLPKTVLGVGELELQHEMAPDKYPMATGIRSQQHTPLYGEQQQQHVSAVDDGDVMATTDDIVERHVQTRANDPIVPASLPAVHTITSIPVLVTSPVTILPPITIQATGESHQATVVPQPLTISSGYVNQEAIIASGIDLSMLDHEIVRDIPIPLPSSSSQTIVPQTNVIDQFIDGSIDYSDRSEESDNDVASVVVDQVDIVQFVEIFFGESQELTYQEYYNRSISPDYHYLVEGLGVYDYVFYPFWKTVHHYLTRPNPKTMQGLLQTEDEVVYDAIINEGYLYLKNAAQVTKYTIPLSSVTRIESPGSNSFIIHYRKKQKRLYCPIGEDVQSWIFCIMLYLISEKDNRFDSFAPVRPNIAAYPLIDGDEAFEAMAHAMLQAKDHIYLTGWCIAPHVFLVRNRETTKNLLSYRLDNIFQTVAKRGVKIYIILWHETTLAGMNLNTVLTSRYLHSLHPNIHVILHPPSTPFMWTHHQKTLIVDDVIGFCGGLDLSWGRYDNSNHTLIDNNQLMLTWPGNDYYNGAVNRCVVCKNKLDSFRDGFDRDRYPRLPWHDIHCVVTGSLARDLASNFIGRWNHHELSSITLKIQQNDDEEIISLKGGASNMIDNASRMKLYHSYLPSWVNLINIKGQVLRSISSWSGSMRTEQSIHNGFIRLIQQAQYYIYIENQYFCSHTELSRKNKNLVAAALIERICKAISNNESFKVYIVIPMHPDGDPLDSSIQQVIKYQNRTLRGIFAAIQSVHPGSTPEDYISIFSLCNYGYIHGIAHFNQVYVHSKLMIIDDRIVVIGSANINDRSLNGDRDSEIAIVFEDYENTQTIMGGRIRRTGKFAKNLRKRLWREHTGWNPDENKSKTQQTGGSGSGNRGDNVPVSPTLRHLGILSHASASAKPTRMIERIQNQRRMLGQNVNDALFKDPVSDALYNKIRRRAAKNTAIYNEVFDHYPGEKHPTIADYRRELEKFDQKVVDNLNGVTIPADPKEQKLAKIKGHLVEYPLMWLHKDPFKKDIRLKVLDTSVFY